MSPTGKNQNGEREQFHHRSLSLRMTENITLG